ncbi:MAG: endolytic transglycosylase MltG [Pseudomonadota bacterium]
MSPSERLEPGRPPEPQKRKKRRKKTAHYGKAVRLISGLLTIFALVLLVAGGAFAYVHHVYTTPGPLTQAKTINIPRGEGRLRIAARLEQAQIISNRWVFILTHLAEGGRPGTRDDLKAGEYQFKPGVPMRQVLATIMGGQALAYKVTFPEGLTSQQIISRLNAVPHLTGRIQATPGEGLLKPATYTYRKGDNRQAIVDWMLREQDSVLQRAWANRQPDLPLQTPQDALILASIVEKETGQAAERGRVAAVFINRLRKGMRLESDPTIIYGIVGGQGSLGRPIYKSEIRQKTPYNTYRINGLPPTPIANPGPAAINAVLNPAQTNELFFVADGTGGHTFSETYEQHKRAVRNWRKIEKQKRAAAKKQAQAAAVTTATVTNAVSSVRALGGSRQAQPTSSDGAITRRAAAPATGPRTAPLPRRNPRL